MLFANKSIDWKQRLAVVVDLMRDMSRQTDPQAVVRTYAAALAPHTNYDGHVSVSRRGLSGGQYKITRSHLWGQEFDPWKNQERLPILSGGLLGALLDAGEPRVIQNLEFADDDPAREHLAGMRSMIAVPHYDAGEAINMICHVRRVPSGFDEESFPELVWMSNLFGRATHNLVLSTDLKKAYDALDRELKVVGNIQRSLLPDPVPQIGNLELATFYQTSRRAGGDYYDFFPLPDDRWGIFIADVSGHGTPAAVVMAMTHSIAHAYPGPPTMPGKMLQYLNGRLAAGYPAQSGTFVTAFYGIFDPPTRTLVYSSAGHNPPRMKNVDGTITALDKARSLPLGIEPEEQYRDSTAELSAGAQIIFYTDGLTETFNRAGDMFGVERLDEALRTSNAEPQAMIDAILAAVEAFAPGQGVADDRTLLAARVV